MILDGIGITFAQEPHEAFTLRASSCTKKDARDATRVPGETRSVNASWVYGQLSVFLSPAPSPSSAPQ